jgi:dephospho-CoA kinase
MERMKTIGILGGVASGKSQVARLLAELGAGVLDADRGGHEVLANDPDIRQLLVDRWGSTILSADGSINRAAVAARVFAAGDSSPSADASAEREFLESVLHPRIRALLAEKTADFAREGRPAVVLDAPLLLEAGWGPLCDLLVLVDAPTELRLARAHQRGWSDEEFFRRESAQMSVDDKRKQAQVVVTNDGSLDSLREAVRDIWQRHVTPQA